MEAFYGAASTGENRGECGIPVLLVCREYSEQDAEKMMCTYTAAQLHVAWRAEVCKAGGLVWMDCMDAVHCLAASYMCYALVRLRAWCGVHCIHGVQCIAWRLPICAMLLARFACLPPAGQQPPQPGTQDLRLLSHGQSKATHGFGTHSQGLHPVAAAVASAARDVQAHGQRVLSPQPM